MVNPAETRPLHFNLAHSEGLLLVAVTRMCPVGIDVEKVGSADDAEEIAARFFSVREVAGLRELPADRRGRRFLLSGPARKRVSRQLEMGLPSRWAKSKFHFCPGSRREW